MYFAAFWRVAKLVCDSQTWQGKPIRLSNLKSTPVAGDRLETHIQDEHPGISIKPGFLKTESRRA